MLETEGSLVRRPTESIEVTRRAYPLWSGENKGTPTMQAYQQAREALLGPRSHAPINNDTLKAYVVAGLAEVLEAIKQAGPAESMSPRNDTTLEGVRYKFQDAFAALEGTRNSSLALHTVIEAAVKEEQQTVDQTSTHEKRAAKFGVGITPDSVYLKTYARTDLGRAAKEDDIKAAEELPSRFKERVAQVKEFLDTNFPKTNKI
jgi:hypothetical protein